MSTLIFDTETTGLPLFREPSDDPRQPHLVQIAAILYGRDGKIKYTLDRIIKPTDWTIPDEVAAIHGITTEMALDVGVALELALDEFLDLHDEARRLVAHNATFDQRILHIALMRAGWSREEADAFGDELPVHDTMWLMKPLMESAPGYKKGKSPKLIEAYRHLFGEDFETAHNALADAAACGRIFWRLVDDGMVTL